MEIDFRTPESVLAFFESNPDWTPELELDEEGRVVFAGAESPAVENVNDWADWIPFGDQRGKAP